ncbi:hypothetical protein Taro_042673 [Colocasia esculenta]|uniref:Uncharacterized protein n=1 Tax=Colocasia esculenta TaxID=4460 RepID=A0A843WEI5_COLES|nr:hypothetical protein [Colocasia esculenta]
MEDDSGAAMVTNLMVGFRESTLSGNPAFFNPLPRSCRPEPPSSTRFKGVVLQQNGNWGAQIYANHQRIWLGTFKSEWSAAVAYDRAATKLRTSDPNRNFPCLAASEPLFQELYTADAVLAMIRDGSYDSKFAEFQRAACEARSEEAAAVPPPAGHHVADHNGVSFHELFQKELTPSDVGKLNRLVIPKKYAVKHFPQIPTIDRDRGGGCRDGEEGATEGIMVEFRDLQGRAWEFRYCYWKSSQSFVFTKGWNRFVKTKQLHAKDTVTFYRCENKSGRRRTFFLIDVGRSSVAGDAVDFFQCGRGGVPDEEEAEMKLGSGVKGMFEIGSSSSSRGRTAGEAEEGEVGMESMADAGLQEKRSIRLFGVQIGER